MQAALKIKTTVTADGKIEISAPELSPGKSVEVIVLLPELETTDVQWPASRMERRSASSILRQASGRRQFKTAEEVAHYLRQERDSWTD
ncbi:MAG: hypothetical protein AB1801_26295 [Chloroflexota bacterium]